MDEVHALKATQYLKYERDYLPWYSGVKGRMQLYLDMFYGKPIFTDLEVMVNYSGKVINKILSYDMRWLS